MNKKLEENFIIESTKFVQKTRDSVYLYRMCVCGGGD